MRYLVAPFLVALLLAGCGGSDNESDSAGTSPEATEPEQSADPGDGGDPQTEVVATGLEVPWQIAFLENGSALVTERPGRVRLITADGQLVPEAVAEIDVDPAGEGGLMGMAIRGEDVFLYMTRGGENEIVRYRYEDEELREQEVVLDGISAATIHDGGRLHLGPDDKLYLTTGDAANPSVAQDPDALNGKIIRLDPESGESEIISLGHRNPQGFDWEPGSDRLIAVEHGQTGNDEVNVIREGANYGWPEIEGEQTREGFEAPIKLYQTPSAPSGSTFLEAEGSEWSGSYFIAMLRGERLQRIRIDGDEVTEDEALFEGEFGRLREVSEGPDGDLYLLTSNRDGRGDPAGEDDLVVRVTPPPS